MSGPTIQEFFFHWPNLYLTTMLVYLLQNALVHRARVVVHDEFVDEQQMFYMHTTKRWTFSFVRKSPLFSVVDIFQSFVLCYTILPFQLSNRGNMGDLIHYSSMKLPTLTTCSPRVCMSHFAPTALKTAL